MKHECHETKRVTVVLPVPEYDRLIKIAGIRVKVGPYIRDVLTQYVEQKEREQKNQGKVRVA